MGGGDWMHLRSRHPVRLDEIPAIVDMGDFGRDDDDGLNDDSHKGTDGMHRVLKTLPPLNIPSRSLR